MRIRHLVLTSSFAGTEQHVCVLANEQARNGHAVEVWGGEPSAMLARLDHRVAYHPCDSVSTAIRQIRPEQQGIIHAHMTQAEAAAVMVGARSRAPVIATRHFAAKRGHSIFGQLARPALRRRIHTQIAVSEFVAAHIDGPSRVVYAGVPSQPPADSAREQVVLVAQRLSPEKRTADALDAFAASTLGERGWRLHFAGRGQQLDVLVDRASSLGLKDQVSFLGFTQDLQQRIHRAAIVLATAPAEPFGLTVIEAMAHGTPIVATASGGHLESVGQVSSDFLYSPGDAAQAGGLLRTLADDRAARHGYGQALQAAQQERFTPERQYAETQKVYDDVVTR